MNTEIFGLSSAALLLALSLAIHGYKTLSSKAVSMRWVDATFLALSSLGLWAVATIIWRGINA